MARNDGTIEREQAQLAYQQQASDRMTIERLMDVIAKQARTIDDLAKGNAALRAELELVNGKYFEVNSWVVATTKAELNEWL